MIQNDIFGKRLKKLRDKTGKSQEEVAKAIGISRARYSHYENNHVEPSIDLIRTLAKYYKVDTDYLLGHSDESNLTDDEEFEDFIQNVRRWYKEAPKDREEDLQRLKRIFEAYKNDE